MPLMDRNTLIARRYATGTTLSSSVPVNVMLDRDTRALKDSISRCRRDVSRPQTDEYARNLWKRVEHGRVHVAEHLVVLHYDAFARGGSRAAVEAMARSLLAMIGHWFEGQSTPAAILELVRRVEVAKAQAAMPVLDLVATRTPKAHGDAEDHLATLKCAVEDLELACARHRFEEAAA